MSKASRIWLLVTAVLVGSQIVAAALLPRGYALTLISDISLALLLFSAILAMVPNALASKGRVRVFWWLMVALSLIHI